MGEVFEDKLDNIYQNYKCIYSFGFVLFSPILLLEYMLQIYHIGMSEKIENHFSVHQ